MRAEINNFKILPLPIQQKSDNVMHNSKDNDIDCEYITIATITIVYVRLLNS